MRVKNKFVMNRKQKLEMIGAKVIASKGRFNVKNSIRVLNKHFL